MAKKVYEQNPRFFPRYIAKTPEIKEQLQEKMYILKQHLNLGGEINVCVEVTAFQMYDEKDVETVQIVPIGDSIDAVVGRGNKGHDNVERSFQMIGNRFDQSYFLTIDKTHYLIFYNPRIKK